MFAQVSKSEQGRQRPAAAPPLLAILVAFQGLCEVDIMNQTEHLPAAGGEFAQVSQSCGALMGPLPCWHC